MSTVDERSGQSRNGKSQPGDDRDQATAGAGQSLPARPSFGEWPGPDLVSEAEAYATYSTLLEDKELRRARQSGALGYLRRKRTILYRRDELARFVRGIVEKDYVPPCRAFRPEPTTPPRTPMRLPTPPASDARPGSSGTMTEDVILRAAQRLGRLPFTTR